jgi:Predicted N6-adenine-specific DNA methylase
LPFNTLSDKKRISVEENYQLVVKTAAGLEPALAEELRNLGANYVHELNRAVSCQGDKALLYKINYCARTALKVLKPFTSFRARNEKQLYDKVQEIKWFDYLTTDQTFAIDAVVNGRFFTHSQYASLKMKDAIVDQFREVYGKRPNVNTLNPDLRINLHISEDKITISFDSSGESLHKRGYRKMVDKAPMNEVLAAGLIQLSGWKANCNFIDCMCGSGTLPIEAAMFAMNIPAGYYRSSFGFMKWADFDKDLWLKVKQEADDQIKEFDHEIWASDRSPKAVAIAKGNITNAHLQHDIHLQKRSMESFTPPEGGGIVIINPPYGDRLEEDDIDAVYKSIGDTLKHNFAGFQVWLITDDAFALKQIGLKPSKKIPVFNGPLECRFVRFDIFDGSYKDMKKQQADKGEQNEEQI